MNKTKNIIIIVLSFLLIITFSNSDSHKNDSEIQDLKGQLNNLNSQVEDYKNQITTLQEEKTKLESEKKTLEQEVEQLKTSNLNKSTQNTSASASTNSTSSPDNTTSTNSYTVYVTNSGKKYHSAGCSYLNKSKISIDKNTAISRGYTPCSKCNP